MNQVIIQVVAVLVKCKLYIRIDSKGWIGEMTVSLKENPSHLQLHDDSDESGLDVKSISELFTVFVVSSSVTALYIFLP